MIAQFEQKEESSEQNWKTLLCCLERHVDGNRREEWVEIDVAKCIVLVEKEGICI